MNFMEIRKEDVQELYDLYKEAKVNKKNSFWFHGHLLLVPYAKYLLEYLNQKYSPKLNLEENE